MLMGAGVEAPMCGTANARTGPIWLAACCVSVAFWGTRVSFDLITHPLVMSSRPESSPPWLPNSEVQQEREPP